MRESETQKAILQYLEAKRIFHYRQNTGAFKTASGGFYHFGTPGATDIVCVIKGQYVGIEVKAKGGKQSPNQKLFQKALEENGGKYLLVYSIDELMKQI